MPTAVDHMFMVLETFSDFLPDEKGYGFYMLYM